MSFNAGGSSTNEANEKEFIDKQAQELHNMIMGWTIEKELIDKECLKNPRYVNLRKKTEIAKLSTTEQQELENLESEQFIKFYTEKIKNTDISAFHLIVFDDVGCSKCKDVIHIYQEIADELSLGFTIMAPREFNKYLYDKQLPERHDTLVKDLAASYSDSKKLDEMIQNNQLAIILYDMKQKIMYPIGSIAEVKDKTSEKKSFIFGLDTFAKPKR